MTAKMRALRPLALKITMDCPYPDTDGDGLNDPSDKCPEIFGPLDNNGCPYPDTDGDGLNDMEDECPKKRLGLSNFKDVLK